MTEKRTFLLYWFNLHVGQNILQASEIACILNLFLQVSFLIEKKSAWQKWCNIFCNNFCLQVTVGRGKNYIFSPKMRVTSSTLNKQYTSNCILSYLCTRLHINPPSIAAMGAMSNISTKLTNNLGTLLCKMSRASLT